MKVVITLDKKRVKVDCADEQCKERDCFWARPYPGVFTQGVGYSQTTAHKGLWVCGTREVRGCPL